MSQTVENQWLLLCATSSGQDSAVHLHLKESGHSFEDSQYSTPSNNKPNVHTILGDLVTHHHLLKCQKWDSNPRLQRRLRPERSALDRSAILTWNPGSELSCSMVMSFGDRVRSSAIREELGVDLLLLRVERSQMRWLGHLVRMPPGRLPGEVFRACPSGRRPPGRPRTRWRDYVSRLAWERLGIPPDELEEVAGEREVWASLLRLLPPNMAAT
ncbi:hypothetical protein D4764_01G0002950 [Takifugu flavidus]|uniref:Uncharacterized protein n=1 Tax=Takifugu flavidus TaxID=433684 RepID=A0A5C6PQC7_9TELE|nr:hypothetical protein D4764_01G0002950 [Takifugu flavidus]